MKKFYVLFSVLSLFLFLGIAVAAVDHTEFIDGDFKTGKDVTKKCLECHEEQAKDVLSTSHWKWKGEPKLLADAPNKELGKANLINNFCIAVSGGNHAGCTKCHIGYGWEDASFDFNNPENIDCLVCHTKEKSYFKAKKTGKAGELNPTAVSAGIVNLKKAAQSVGKPDRDNCGNCHFYGGGGDAVKHGDLDSTMANPSPELDVHMGKLNFTCQECHKTENHKIAGASTMMATYEGRVNCSDCHDNPHADNKILNQHTKSVACQTCHIPAFAREMATKMYWDWSKSGKDFDEIDEQYGHETYKKIKGEFFWDKNVTPTYAWYNGKVKRYLVGQTIDPAQIVKITSPVGSINDPNSKIYPFKVHRGWQPYDTVFQYLLTPKTVGGYWSHFDWNKGLKDGAKAAGIKFSGKFDFVRTQEWIGISHMVAPKKDVLKCNDCHGTNERINWEALGYEGDPIKVGSKRMEYIK